MLETGGGRQTCGNLQFLDQLPRVESVQEIDIAGTAVQYFNGQFALFHVDSGRLLVGVATILQFKFLHTSEYIFCSSFFFPCFSLINATGRNKVRNTLQRASEHVAMPFASRGVFQPSRGAVLPRTFLNTNSHPSIAGGVTKWILWSWRGLNPRPNRDIPCFLHAYSGLRL